MKRNKWQVGTYLKENRWLLLLSFLVPVMVLMIVYGMIGIYPGSYRTIMASDSFHQLSNFLASYNTMMKGSESIFYTWYLSFGLNYWAFISYYLGGLFTPLVFFFDNNQIPEALYFLTLLKFGCSGVAFSIFSQATFRIPKWGHLTLSIFYSLMGFALAFSEMIMWLDTFVYLPLVILGIHRLMDKRKPLVLFLSYLVLFVTNFYMAFIVGFFSFLYFFTRLFIQKENWKQKLGSYLGTSLLAGGASMPMILPTILDLQGNGEALTAINSLKTADTGALDLIVKNFLGVYDTTQYGSAPFVFIGLLPLVLMVYYFTVKSIPLREKLAYGGLFAFIILSFYFEPLNLFWQGMHAPNMFLFRYSFVFSFLVILLAGYGWEKLTEATFDRLLNIVLGLVILFVGTRVFISFGTKYRYVTLVSFGLTMLFLFLYLFLLRRLSQKQQAKRSVVFLFLFLVTAEVGINTYATFKGIKSEWPYPSRAQYLYNYDDIKSLVDQTKEENDRFYRLETMNSITKNDSLNYGYSGVAMFSSIRNRNSLSYLHDLGYRSWGTNLQNDYRNNTILMDMISGIKYNLSKDKLMKYGFNAIEASGDYTLYENQYAMPLGVMTDTSLYDEGVGRNQTSLFNQLSGKSNSYYTFIDAELKETENVKVEADKETDTIIYHNTSKTKRKPGIKAGQEEEVSTEPMVLTWEAVIPANKQAYFSLYPLNYGDLSGADVTLKVNGISQITRMNMTGQYYNLGYYDKEKAVTFTVEIDDATKAQFMTPDIALLDIEEYTEASEAILAKGVAFDVSGRKAKATVKAEYGDVLFTTIPYDKGWKVYVDGKQADITPYREAFLSVELEQGLHEVEFVFLPQGLLLGSGISGISLLVFGGYLGLLKKRKNGLPYQTSDESITSSNVHGPSEPSTTPSSQQFIFDSEKEDNVGTDEKKEVESPAEKVAFADPEAKTLLTSFSFSDEKQDFDFSLKTETKLKKNTDVEE